MSNLKLNFNDLKLKYEKHDDLLIFSLKALDKYHLSECDLTEELLDQICERFKCKRIAVKDKIAPDDFRTPLVRLVRGDNPWVIHVDNGIKYSFDITKCMFSSGNIKEKLRVSQMKCDGETVVDLFAGIGYFTLPFLVHSNASLVHACEWNVHAMEALVANLELNNVKDKCVLHFGDNKLTCPVGIADRVYMGLIPTSTHCLTVACRALKSDGGIIHVHENVNSFATKGKLGKTECWNNWGKELVSKVKLILSDIRESEKESNVELIQVVQVKRYAPHIDHLVADIKVF